MGDLDVEMLGSFVCESIALIVNSFLQVCMEIVKFLLILLILYYFTIWSFQLLEDISMETPGEFSLAGEKQNNFKIERGLEAHQIEGEIWLRIGPPDEKLVRHRASLLEQLETEAEFEENIKKHIKSEPSASFPDRELDTNNITIKTRNSEEAASFKDLFISQIKRESKETSRPSQTNKTSLGKKSQPRKNEENVPRAKNSTYDQVEDEEILEKSSLKSVPEIKQESETDANANANGTSSIKREAPSLLR